MSMFSTTRWSLVLATRDDDASSRDALAWLCTQYRAPVVAYVRRFGYPRQDAEDLAQAFFVKFLESRYHADADPARGRFRSFLLTALKRFLANARDHDHAQKRGGGGVVSGVDSGVVEMLADDVGGTPDETFDRMFARTVVEHALARLTREAREAGKTELFDATREFLLESPEPARYGEVADRLGMRRNTLAVTVKRLRARLQELVRAEIAETCSDPGDVETELRAVRDALA
jgi:RNA polymerase sigma factor (sigma-70 family)